MVCSRNTPIYKLVSKSPSLYVPKATKVLVAYLHHLISWII